MDSREQRRFVRRVRVLMLLFFVGLSFVGARSAMLQIVEHEHLARLARDEYLRDIRLPARRGNIYDRHGKPMALSVEVPSVYANPTRVADPRASARVLADVLGISRRSAWDRLARDRLFVWLKRRVSPKMAEQVRALNIEGVQITKEPKRFYPNREVGAHVLGFAGLDSRGLEGLERAYDDVLRGEPTVIEAVRDARGNSVLQMGALPSASTDGADLHLTLDLQLQHEAEAALNDVVRRTGALSAQAVVLEVDSAQVLAMAVEPGFNPNEAAKYPAKARRNRVVTDMFEPGSTVKPLVVAAALDAGAIEGDAVFFCENGSMEIGGHRIRDTKPHGWLGLRAIIAKSSNICAAKVGEALGKQRLHAALWALGLGKRTGVTFPGETSGSLRPAGSWSTVGTATISFGHGVAASTLQLAAAYRVIAAGGLYRAPTLVRFVEGSDGHPRTPRASTERRVFGEEIVRAVGAMMKSVVGPEGTGMRAAVAGYQVAGKTGTSQKIDPVAGGYSQDRFVAVFAGYLPAHAPRAVVVVAVDEPQTEHSGGAVAGPTFALIARAAMRRLGVVPERRSDEPVAAKTAEPTAYRGVPKLAVLDAARAQPGSVPSFIGLTPRQAVERYTQLGLALDLEMEGSGTVVRQLPAPGSDKTKARALRLLLAHNEAR